MTFSKRMFDIVLALLLGALFAPIIIGVSLWILLSDGRPVLYISERMKTAEKAFALWKFRTMTVVAEDAGVSGGDKAARITPVGRVLRKYRLDELPQLWNILRGDMSFVGPRPPLRQYVDLCPELYAQVLSNRPGVTGLATLVFHAREEKLLADCATPEETEQVYVRRCIPAKARLDLIYARNQSLCFDLGLMWDTVIRVFARGKGRR